MEDKVKFKRNRVLEHDLYEQIMQGNWKYVVEKYRDENDAAFISINELRVTALHIAISNGEESIVEELVKLILEKKKSALKLKNKDGNTPLHLAASTGTLRMCICISKADPYPHSLGLGIVRNKEGETPLFLAALHGKTDIFVCLYHLCFGSEDPDSPYLAYYRKNNGQTILHCTIKRGYMDLAFHILQQNRLLANSVDENGTTPLHLLANAPSAFKSGCHLGRWNKIIYYCTHVDALKVISAKRLIELYEDERSPKFPKNYKRCIDFFKLLRKMIVTGGKVAVTFGRTVTRPIKEVHNKRKKPDEKNQNSERKNVSPHSEESEQESLPERAAQKSAQSVWILTIIFGLGSLAMSIAQEIAKVVFVLMMVIFGLGSNKLRKMKEKHILSDKIGKMLIKAINTEQYFRKGSRPRDRLEEHSSGSDDEDFEPEERQEGEKDQKSPLLIAAQNGITEKSPLLIAAQNVMSPLLIAAQNGITEIVNEILFRFPMAIHETHGDKNIVLLAVQNRQPHVCKLLFDKYIPNDTLLLKVDDEKNSAMHLAATLGENRPWLIPGAALQMQWEIKWYEFVKNNVPQYFLTETNEKGGKGKNKKEKKGKKGEVGEEEEEPEEGKTPDEIFTLQHQDLVKEGGKWLKNTSNSFSVVAALIATVAFATSNTIPGGVNDKGMPNLEGQTAFNIFAISSFVALCFSVTALFYFLSIVTSRYQEQDFRSDLPRKLLLGLTSLFVSITAMLVSFCAAHFFLLKNKLKDNSLPVYAVTCLPITLFAIAQFPLYFDLVQATYQKVPDPSYKVVSL